MPPRRKTPLPARSLEEVLDAFPTLRQSLLSKADNCLLGTLFELEGRAYTNAAQARGQLGHKTAARILTTLRATGEVKMPVAEGLEILYEVCAQRDVPDAQVVIVPARERRLLRIAIVRLCGNEFRMSQLMDVERRLEARLTYPHPDGGIVERRVTGQPDALIADPPDGAVVLDWKFQWGTPPAGKADEHLDDPDHVSYQGYFQQRMYALLVMRNYPAVQRVVLREFYPLVTVARYGTVLRADLEHIERELAQICELIDRALVGGSGSQMWQPSPGKHCAYCEAPTRCPIAADVRAREGGIGSWPEAERAAAEYVLAGEVRKDLHEALKAWVDVHGAVPVKSAKGRYVVRWKGPRGNRTFGVYVPDDSDRGPKDPRLESVFATVAERARSTT